MTLYNHGEQRKRPKYTLAQFQQRHGLETSEAERLYGKFGPVVAELDALMAAKQERSNASAPAEGRKSKSARN